MSRELVILILTGLLFPLILKWSEFSIEWLKAKFKNSMSTPSLQFASEEDLRKQLQIEREARARESKFLNILIQILDTLSVNRDVDGALSKYNQHKAEFE